MHTGLSLIFQNVDDDLSDADVYRHELELAARAESSGFESVWVPEHHFTSYQLTPNVPQFLAWLASQTSTLKLGTMVSVLPWQDPIRTAENFVMLDHLSGGRGMLGIGRGLGRVEFDGFRLQMGESRRRFSEYAEAILNGLDSGFMEYAGEFYRQPRVELRPRPFAPYRGRTFASAISPQSIDLMAGLGAGLMVIAQKPWETVEAEMANYRRRYLEVNGEEAPKPILCVFVGVAPTEEEAQTLRDVYLQRYARSTVEHYEFDNVGFAQIEGYEYYAALSRNIEKHGLDRFCSFLADLQVWGTPDQVVERVLGYVDRLDAGAVVMAPSFGNMPPEVSAANYDLLAREVVPRLQAYDVGGDVGVRHGAGPVRERGAQAQEEPGERPEDVPTIGLLP
ncbi:LLM class flavin-dependent oxidoreductase [Conexibacter stalactiti]|uniref:LLM class flavin-dependent oxidoreductase n=1 Tax=Conexibacter stalactiti TaxID=1940611 RepID=A0ABU4HWD8_9ACTN|nr:LLM class flavin-dependent oxidoreductase [Conexibacter stalactiti]MDW5597636.1 LLM class flavin-dependent oxidoreductase [Conexibacter stalactiti]MEC5038278.1 LLM class flavin-dependent oxidoreductase [Conexibacter stalactiti]